MTKKTVARCVVPMFIMLGLGPLAKTVHATASTHIWAPSADIQAFNVWHITSDFYVPVEYDRSGIRIPTITNVGLTVGVLPFKNLNLELGFDHKSGLGTSDRYPFYGNAKLGVPENTWGNFQPGVAVGAFDVGTRKGQTDFNMVYGKMTKSFSAGEFSLGRLSLGYFAGNSKLLLGENGQEDSRGILAAWERTVPEISDKLWICVEYMGSRSVYGSLNLGASWRFAPNVTILGAYDAYNNRSLAHTITMQIDIDI